MVKSQEQPNTATGHPLDKQIHQAGEMARRLGARQDAQEFKIEEIEQWKICVNGVASTPNGKLFLTSLVQHAGLFASVKGRDTVGMVEKDCKLKFYLDWVRPFLDPQLRKEIE